LQGFIVGERAKRQHRRAFTLIELLVVVGIIALLIALLLPALQNVQQQAMRVKCLTNLRSIGQAMSLYAADYKGAIPGSANTSSRHFYPPSPLINSSPVLFTADDLPAGPIAVTDYVEPLARAMRMPLSESRNAADRYRRYREMGMFLCPAAMDMVSTAFLGSGGPDAGEGPPLGYATAFSFLLTEAWHKSGVTYRTRISSGPSWWELPAGYFPTRARVGRASEKIYAADATKFASPEILPNYNLAVAPGPHQLADSTPYTDYGAFTIHTRAYDRTAAHDAGGIDCRVFSYRHGTRSPKRPLGTYRMNAVFYDGHVETLDEVRSLDPDLWLPRGTIIPDGSKLWNETTLHHVTAFPYVVN
jgi:prepilin-type N-terminal cleavage/methylation domain-containing protein/prepilin-type processing-associated H-X9-DG protein